MLDFGRGKGFAIADVKGALSVFDSFLSSTFDASASSFFSVVGLREKVELLLADKLDDPKANIPPGLLAPTKVTISKVPL